MDSKNVLAVIVGVIALGMVITSAYFLIDEYSSNGGSTNGTQSVPEQEAITVAEQDYLSTLTDHTETMGDAFTNLGILFESPQYFDDDWILYTAVELVIIQLVYEEVLEISPPSSLTNIHSKFIEAMAHYNTSTYLIIQGIDYLNPSLIEQATTEMDIGTQLVYETTQLIEAFYASH